MEDEPRRLSGLVVPKSLAELKEIPVRFSRSIEKDAIGDEVVSMLGLE